MNNTTAKTTTFGTTTRFRFINRLGTWHMRMAVYHLEGAPSSTKGRERKTTNASVLLDFDPCNDACWYSSIDMNLTKLPCSNCKHFPLDACQTVDVCGIKCEITTSERNSRIKGNSIFHERSRIVSYNRHTA